MNWEGSRKAALISTSPSSSYRNQKEHLMRQYSGFVQSKIVSRVLGEKMFRGAACEIYPSIL
jgi:membrane protein involved in colicin uptake